MLPVFSPLANPEPDRTSVEEFQSALDDLRRQKLRLEQRERQLLRGLAAASRLRMQELVAVTGMPAPAFEDLLRRAVGSSRRKRTDGPSINAVAAIEARKAPLRFRHPDDPGLVWSGRGKTPRWILDLQAHGRLDQARIAPDE